MRPRSKKRRMKLHMCTPANVHERDFLGWDSPPPLAVVVALVSALDGGLEDEGDWFWL